MQTALSFSSPSGISYFVDPPHDWQKLILRLLPVERKGGDEEEEGEVTSGFDWERIGDARNCRIQRGVREVVNKGLLEDDFAEMEMKERPE